MWKMLSIYHCNQCGWVGDHTEQDWVEDPKEGSEMVWTICPSCRAADDFTHICEAEGCEKPSSVGRVHSDGICRFTCSAHSRGN